MMIKNVKENTMSTIRTSVSFDKVSGKYTCKIGQAKPFKTTKKSHIVWRYEQETGLKLTYDQIVATSQDAIVQLERTKSELAQRLLDHEARADEPQFRNRAAERRLVAKLPRYI
jgi:hypothetical protein